MRSPIPYAIVALVASAAIALGCFAIVDSTPQPEQTDDELALVLDVDNAKQMHNHGMPTKSDVMAYHVYGHWGYKQGDDMRIFAELPGSVRVWDEFYGIGYNKAFKY